MFHDDNVMMCVCVRAARINLTAADTVILHDIDFNPHVDRQAEDRVHRMGQQKPVSVYRLVCKGSIDEALLAMQEKKSKLEGALLQEVNTKPNRREMAELLQAALKMTATL
jgi:SWI/SNF-related matrix-associated actin-dependent regulator of chromatin subfamily A containing DEAD/H box 1